MLGVVDSADVDEEVKMRQNSEDGLHSVCYRTAHALVEDEARGGLREEEKDAVRHRVFDLLADDELLLHLVPAREELLPDGEVEEEDVGREPQARIRARDDERDPVITLGGDPSDEREVDPVFDG